MKGYKKKLRLDIFQLGLVFIPFDNLFFAPSGGWATVAPIIFLLYVLVNIRCLGVALGKNRNVLVIAVTTIIYQILLLLVNGLKIAALIDSILTLSLGLLFYLALIVRYVVAKRDADVDAYVLYHSYCASFIYGIIRLIVAKLFPAQLYVFRLIEKRFYDRLAFSFTEPSFISVHVFGVLLLFSYLVKKDIIAKKMIRLGFLFCIVSVFANSSARCLIDMVIFVVLLIFKIFFMKRKHIVRNVCVFTGVTVVLMKMISHSSRVLSILSGGMSVDASGASRLFRVNAVLYGFLKEPLRALLGYGMGNLVIPFSNGYADAYAQYHNAYMAEVNMLRNVESLDSIFSFPFKFVAEWGLIVAVILFACIVRKAHKRHVDMFVVAMTMWLYVQFDSYAFYALWILLFIICFYRDDEKKKSYIERIIAV